ncbi:MAG: response regulator transcription factor [Frankia sp.]|nr:response regulator transcription factor [Frankia sp.]
MTGPRVVVVDDHPVFVKGLVTAFAELGGVDVVGTAATVADALRVSAEQRPDVVLMDLSLPDGDGVAATRALLAAYPTLAVLVVSMYDDDATVADTLAAGARGYLVKGAQAQEIAQAVLVAAAGGVVFGAALAERVTRRLASPPAASLPGLSAREVEVLALMAEGHGNAEIARRLVLSPKTVRNHVWNVVHKLGAADRQDAARRAREAGLGPKNGRASGSTPRPSTRRPPAPAGVPPNAGHQSR